MAQKPQIIDITKSYLPGDPNSFVQNLVNTDKEDGEEKALPVLPYEGYNFLPTAYGYKSYFGINSKLNLSALSSRVQYILLWQLPNYESRLIALCEDGIWVALADTYYPAWIQVVTHTYNTEVFEEWTWCVIENILYMYKQGGTKVYKTGIGHLDLPDIADIITDVTPGGLVGIPSSYQTFAVIDGNVGDGTSFWNGNFYEVYIQYSDGVDFGLHELVLTIPSATDTTSISISVTGAVPIGIDRVRVYIYDDDLGDTFAKDFLLSSFPLSIPNLTGFSSVALYQPQTLVIPAYGGTVIPGFYNFIPDSYFLGNPLYLKATSWESWETSRSTTELVITSFVPSFLNMTGQMGIFRAGLRLGFWDSSNSVSWSSNLDLTDFTPSLENLAGNTVFGYVVGRIVLCKGHGEGFIVYSTKSIVGVTFSSSGNLLWDSKKILDSSGIASSRAVTCGSTDDEHFVFSTTGIYTIGKYNSLTGVYDEKNALPELYDYLRESRDPVVLKIIQDRYIFFSLYNTDYIYGKQSFYYGTVNPLLSTINWYIPSDTTPTGSSTILPDQLWEIIKNEISGYSPTKRKDGDWIPRYTTTVDIMDDRYYSFWRAWVGERGSRLPYVDYSTYLDITPMLITTGDITTYLDAQRPSSPPDASRYGKLKTITGIRADEFMESDEKNNNKALIYGQESEWEAYREHALANKTRIEAYSSVVTTLGLNNPNSDNTVDTVIGIFITGDGNNIWLTTEGPSEKAAKEIILRRTFNKAYQITKHVRTQNTGYAGASAPVRGAYPTGRYYTTDDNPSGNGIVPGSSSSTHTLTLHIESRITSPSIVDTPISTHNYVGVGTYPGSPVGTYHVHTYYDGMQWSYDPVPGYDRNIWHIDVFYVDNIEIPGSVWTVALEYGSLVDAITDAGTLAYNEGVAEYNAAVATSANIVTTTYTVNELTGSYGYSQFRALVTHWDRVKFGLYGSYEILETVTAEAMTPKVWDSVYGTDRGTGRNQIWSYADYKAQAVTRLTEGKMSDYSILPPDPNATPYLTIDGYNQSGVTNAHSSFILPGTSFVLQTGSIEASYPTYAGALVYDIQLKKWGKYKGEHKVLLETYPLNSAENNTISYSDLGSNAAIFDTTGFLYLFDSKPTDSWIRYGKVGFQRLGMTWSGEIKVSMRYASDFRIQVDSSLTGKLLDMGLSQAANFYSEIEAVFLTDISARWHSIKISGNYDLTGLEVRGTLAGRR